MFNQVIYNNLQQNRERFYSLAIFPPVLREILPTAPELLKDATFFASMAPLSVYHSRTCFINPYSDEESGVQLQVYISAEQGGGKGNLDRIQKRIMEKMRTFNNSELAKEREYAARRKSAQNSRTRFSEPAPDTCVFLVPPAISKTKLCFRALSIEKKYGEEKGVYFYTFSPELGMAIDAAKSDHTDLRTINRITYDGGAIGMDCKHEECFDGEVYVSQSLLYLSTPNVMTEYFNDRAIENGILSRATIAYFGQELGAEVPKFGKPTQSEIDNSNKVLDKLFDEIFDPDNSNTLMPKKCLDIEFLKPEIEYFQATASNEAVDFSPIIQEIDYGKGSKAIDTFRRRSCLSALRIAAICYNLYLVENAISSPEKQLSDSTIKENIKTIFKFAAFHILHTTLVLYGDKAEIILRPDICINKPIFDMLPANFSRSDVKYYIDKYCLVTPIRTFLHRWKNTNRIIELENGIFQKVIRN